MGYFEGGEVEFGEGHEPEIFSSLIISQSRDFANLFLSLYL